MKKINDFYMALKSNKKLMQEITLERKKYGNDKLSPEKTKEFLTQNLIPIAQREGFDISLNDFFNSEHPQKLNDEDLELISGGISNIWVGLGLSSIALLGSIAPIATEITQASATELPATSTAISQNISKNSEDTKSTTQKSQKLNQYLQTHQDLPEIDEQNPYNDADALVLANLCQFPMNKNLDLSKKDYTIHNYSSLVDTSNLGEDREIFLKSIENNNRYKDIKMGDFEIDSKKGSTEDEVAQFGGITFKLLDQTKVIAMQGTDNTFNGWKDSLDLIWNDLILSQDYAVKYVQKIADKYKDSKLSITGHSKGGNLAVYGALMATESNSSINNRLTAITNFDGPGLRNDVIEKHSESFDLIKDKITTYVPQTSIVGSLWNNKDCINYKTIYSDAEGFAQHETFSWHLSSDAMESKNNEKFISPENNDRDFLSKGAEKVINSILSQVPSDQLKKFSTAIFKIIGYNDENATSVTDHLSKEMSVNSVVKNLSTLTPEELTSIYNVAHEAVISLPIMLINN